MNLAVSKPAAPPLSKLAIASLVLTILCMPIGLVLAIIALVQISRAGKDRLRGQLLAVIALCLCTACVPVSGMLAAIAIPNFVQFQCRSKQAEAKTNLKSGYIALQSYRGEHGVYGSLEEVGFAPLGIPSRYRYELVEQGAEHFVLRATATTPDMSGDTWEITHENVLTSVMNRCRG